MDNIFIYYFIPTFVEAHSRSTWSVRPCYTYASMSSFQTKDHRPRSSITTFTNFCYMLHINRWRHHYTNELLNKYYYTYSYTWR